MDQPIQKNPESILKDQSKNPIAPQINPDKIPIEMDKPIPKTLTKWPSKMVNQSR